jgi:DNA-binding MarR family transcriptional regulator
MAELERGLAGRVDRLTCNLSLRAAERIEVGVEVTPMKPPELTLADYRALAAFRVQLRRFLSFSSSAAKAAGLEPQQYQAILAIKGHVGEDAPSISDLAAQLLIRQHTAVELAKRLETAGLVSRHAHAKDRRIVLLHLTPTADATLAALVVKHLEELEQIDVAVGRLFGRGRSRAAHGPERATPPDDGT